MRNDTLQNSYFYRQKDDKFIDTISLFIGNGCRFRDKSNSFRPACKTVIIPDADISEKKEWTQFPLAFDESPWKDVLPDCPDEVGTPAILDNSSLQI
ncbi:hypothetical protein Bpfe_021190 [Biomphalaria pfeifferi]|uniref:Uncharacterized protein n=1 Tax=Biomphalaria pfeifferi TaxID=112525 RepID=A0AAD8B766_BIOPF|nr:hypothetical protein Bpfe_021190 [Biomphalaria pfeifferi]